MATPSPSPPWHQFSLRTLLLLGLFVAALCSLALCTHWYLSLVIGSTVLIGGIAGRVVAGTGHGFVQGVVFAVNFFLLAGIGLVFMGFAIPQLWDALWRLGGLHFVLGIASLIGGIVGGFTVRPRSGQ